MKLHAAFAALTLLGACAASPDPDHAFEVQPAPFTSQNLYFKVVDDGASGLQQVFDHVPADARDGITRVVDRIAPDTTDVYLTAPSRDALAHAAMPADRELAFGPIAGGRWRTYVVFPTVELDGTAIAHAASSSDPNTGAPTLTLDLTPAATMQFAALTTRIVDHRLAIIADGTVVSAPRVESPITGGHVQITFGPNSGTEAQALAAAFQP